MSTSLIRGGETGRAIVADWETMVVVGQIARAHGNRGPVIVNPETDFPDVRFQEGAVLVALVGNDTREVRIAGVRFKSGRPVIALDGVTTIDAAESLAGVKLMVPGGSTVKSIARDLLSARSRGVPSDYCRGSLRWQSC